LVKFRDSVLLINLTYVTKNRIISIKIVDRAHPSRRTTSDCSIVVITGFTTEGLIKPAPCQAVMSTSPMVWVRPHLTGDRHNN
jgi:hypothetical protein